MHSENVDVEGSRDFPTMPSAKYLRIIRHTVIDRVYCKTQYHLVSVLDNCIISYCANTRQMGQQRINRISFIIGATGIFSRLITARKTQETTRPICHCTTNAPI